MDDPEDGDVSAEILIEDRRAMFARLVDLERECSSLRQKLGVATRMIVSDAVVDVSTHGLFESHASDFLSIHAQDGTYLFASRSARRLFGYEPSDLVGRSAYDFIHPDDLARIAATHVTQYEPDALVTIEYRMRKPDGSYVWVETSTSTSRSAAGLEQIVSVTRDVSERHAHVEAQSKLITELEQRIEQVRVLTGLLPICAWCKSIRDDDGYWHEVDEYLSAHTRVDFTHGVCPNCIPKIMRPAG